METYYFDYYFLKTKDEIKNISHKFKIKNLNQNLMKHWKIIFKILKMVTFKQQNRLY